MEPQQSSRKRNSSVVANDAIKRPKSDRERMAECRARRRAAENQIMRVEDRASTSSAGGPSISEDASLVVNMIEPVSMESGLLILSSVLLFARS